MKLKITKSKRLILQSTDLFMANLAYGLINGVDAQGVTLYDAQLYEASIKNSDFSFTTTATHILDSASCP